MITIKTKIGNTVVEVQQNKVTDAIKMAAFFSELPETCPRCGEPVHLTYRKAQEYEFYGMQCSHGHQTTFGQLKAGGFYYKKDEVWKTYDEQKSDPHEPHDIGAPAPPAGE